MPLIYADEQDQDQWAVPQQTPATGGLPPPERLPTDTLGAAFRQNNWIVNVGRRMMETNYPPVPGYEPMDDLKNTEFENHSSKFLMSRSPGETEGIKARIRQEEKDKRDLAAMGWVGTLESVAAGVADPVALLIPGGEAVMSARGGLSVGRTLVSTGRAGAIATGITEGILAGAQETRTPTEVATNIASGTILSAIIGAPIAAALSRGERLALTRSLDRSRAEIARQTTGEGGAARVDQAASHPATNAAAGDVLPVNAPGAAATPAPTRAAATPEVAALPDTVVSPSFIRALEAQFEGTKRVSTVGLSVTPEESGALVAAGIKPGRNEAITYEGLQALKAEAARRAPETPEGAQVTSRDTAGIAQRQRETLNPAEEPGVPRTAESPLPTQEPAARPLPQEVPLEPAPSMGGAASAVGAAAVDTRQLELKKGPGGIPLPPERVSPVRRMLGSASVEFRRITADLLESVYEFLDNDRGVATSQGPSADRAVKTLLMTMRADLHQDVDELFSQYRKINNSRWAKMRTQVSDYFGGPPPETLSLEQFKAEASKAFAFGDKHESIPEAQELAQRIRRKIVEPLRKRAEATIPGFKSHVDIEGESYFPHDWAKDVIGARRPEFQRKVTDKLIGDQEHARSIQQKLEFYNAQLDSWTDQVIKYEKRLATNEAQRGALETRMSERAMEAARGERRVATVEQGVTGLQEEIQGARDFITRARQDIKDSAVNKNIDELEARVNELARADRPMTEAQMAALEQEELRTILTGTNRMAAEMLVGRRKFPKLPSFLQYIIENGGLSDVGGDVASIVGGPRGRPGLINKQKGRELDALGEKIQEDFPGYFPRRNDVPGGGAPSKQEVLDLIDASSRGQEPEFMLDQAPANMREQLTAARTAAVLEEAFSRAGVEVKTIADVAKVFRDEQTGAGRVTLEDIDRIAADMEASGQRIPVRGQRLAAAEELGAAKAEITDTRQMIADAIRFRDQRSQRLRVAEARGEEAAIAERASFGRLGVLNERLTLREGQQMILEQASEIARRQRDEVRGKIEEEIGNWEGTSTAEAKAAIKARENYASKRAALQAGVEGPQLPAARIGDRLTMADDAVDRSVRRVLASNTDLSREELDAQAGQLVDRILGGPDGRLDYDFDSGGPILGPPREGSAPRGSAARRRFDVSNEWAMDFLNKDIEQVTGNYLRTMVPDIVLGEKFGDPEMPMAFRQVNESYDRLRKELDARTDIDAAEKEKLQQKLRKEQVEDVGDLADARDIIRGVYGWSSDRVMQNLGTMAQHAKKVANIVSMGSAAVSSIPDFAGVIARWGMGGAMHGWNVALQTIRAGNIGAGLTNAELKGMGIGLDVVLNRQRGMEDMANVYSSQSRVGRVLSSVNDLTFMVNGLNWLTDFQKTIAGVAAHRGYLEAIERVVKGTQTADDLTRLGAASIDPIMAGKIWTQVEAHHSVVDDLVLANVKEWEDRAAANAFSAAVARDADIAVITPGHDVPNMMSHPMVSAVTQFKRIIMGANERILVANMQRHDANALISMSTMLLLGAASWRITMALQGRNEQANKASTADVVREAMNRANITGWMGEAHETAAKMTGQSLNAFRLFGTTKEPTRFASRNTLETLLGPTAGRIGNLSQIAGAIGRGDWAASDTRALRNAGLPWQNLFYTRGLVDKAEQGFNHFFGVPERRERAR